MQQITEIYFKYFISVKYREWSNSAVKAFFSFITITIYKSLFNALTAITFCYRNQRHLLAELYGIGRL